VFQSNRRKRNFVKKFGDLEEQFEEEEEKKNTYIDATSPMQLGSQFISSHFASSDKHTMRIGSRFF
jgi:hypothetical protein